jgi:hypothetical protein
MQGRGGVYRNASSALHFFTRRVRASARAFLGVGREKTRDAVRLGPGLSSAQRHDVRTLGAASISESSAETEAGREF